MSPVGSYNPAVDHVHQSTTNSRPTNLILYFPTSSYCSLKTTVFDTEYCTKPGWTAEKHKFYLQYVNEGVGLHMLNNILISH